MLIFLIFSQQLVVQRSVNLRTVGYGMKVTEPSSLVTRRERFDTSCVTGPHGSETSVHAEKVLYVDYGKILTLYKY